MRIQNPRNNEFSSRYQITILAITVSTILNLCKVSIMKAFRQ